jgi:hypothetical protein
VTAPDAAALEAAARAEDAAVVRDLLKDATEADRRPPPARPHLRSQTLSPM